MNVKVNGVKIVVLPVSARSFSKTKRVGNNLEITLSNGYVITLEDYFPNKPKLLTNEKSDNVNEIVITDDGDVSGIVTLTQSEAESLLGNSYPSLSSQNDNILLLSDSNDTPVAALTGRTYAVEALAATAAIVTGMLILDDRDKSHSYVKNTKAPEAPGNVVVKNNEDGTQTIEGTGEPGATVIVKDKDGNVIGEGKVGDDGTFKVDIPAQEDGSKVLNLHLL